MAKMTGPLLSMDARGMIGGRYVYQRAMGETVMRYRWQQNQTITADQAPYQQAHGQITHLISWIKREKPHFNTSGVDDYQMLREIAGRRDRWNDFVRRQMLKHEQTNMIHIAALWAAMTPTEQAQWDTEAASVAPGLAGYTGKSPPGWPAPTWSAGYLLHLYFWILYLTGATTTEPGSTP